MKNKLAFFSILVLATFLRTGGVYRGLDVRYNYHPDKAKQVAALSRYLDGEYIWYINSRAYDGYPLFLSHLDEWTLRVARPLQRALHNHLQPDRPQPCHTSRTQLYAWSRTRRVVHGMLAVLFTMLAANKLGFSRRASHIAGLLLALSPIAAAVTRFSTGEVGTDMFAVATVWLLAQHAARPRLRWLLAAGAAVGWCFASKYNGVLVAIIPIVYLTMRVVAQRGGFQHFITEGIVSLGGFVAAVLIAAPQWIWSFKRTLADTLGSFDYIKHYSVPDEILAMTAWQQAVLSLRVNTLPLIGHIGWFLVALALAALACGLVERLPSLRNRQPDTPESRAAWLRLGSYLFPPFAFLVSLAGKLNFQPMHFSFILPALCIAAIGGLRCLMQRRGRLLRLTALVLLAAALADFAWSIERANFFWRRDDIMYGVAQMDQIYHETSPVKSFRRGQPTASTIKAFSLEGRHPSNFRNRPHTVKGADGAWQTLLTPRSPRKTLEDIAPLPAGRYRLTIDVEAMQADTAIAIELRDRDGRLTREDSAARTFKLTDGLQRLEWTFAKRFAPYEVDIRVLLENGACRIARWTLIPDATAIYDDLAALAAGSEPPAWAAPPPPAAPLAPEHVLPAGGRYGHCGAIGLDGLHLPDRIHPGIPFPAMAVLSLHGATRWEEQRIDVRLIDERGRAAMSFRLQVSRSRMGNAPGVPESITPPSELPPGRYRVQARIWNSRTLLRLPLQTTEQGIERTRQWVHAGSVNVTPVPEKSIIVPTRNPQIQEVSK